MCTYVYLAASLLSSVSSNASNLKYCPKVIWLFGPSESGVGNLLQIHCESRYVCNAYMGTIHAISHAAKLVYANANVGVCALHSLTHIPSRVYYECAGVCVIYKHLKNSARPKRICMFRIKQALTDRTHVPHIGSVRAGKVYHGTRPPPPPPQPTPPRKETTYCVRCTSAFVWFGCCANTQQRSNMCVHRGRDACLFLHMRTH